MQIYANPYRFTIPINGYFCILVRMKARILVAIILIFSFYEGYSQPASYILKQQFFKTNLTSIKFSPDGSLLLAGFQDGSFRLMDPVSFETVLEVPDAHYKAVNAMAMPPKMDFVLTAGHNRIKLWDLKGQLVAEWTAHATTIWNVEISKDGKYAVSSAFNKTFLLWDVYNGLVIKEMRGHDDVTMAVAISSDSRWIASGSNDLSIRIWDLESGEQLTTLHGPSQDIYDVDFSPDNLLLAAASKDRSVRIYDIREEKMVHLLKGHRDMVMEVDFNPEGTYLVSGSADRSVMLWDVTSGERIHTFLDNEEAVLDVVFHPDGNSVYSISFAGDLTRWEIHPEIFVLKYFREPYEQELADNPVFGPKRAEESRKAYQQRLLEAEKARSEIVDKYYRRYLSERVR
jgi:WD40 repeat protein